MTRSAGPRQDAQAVFKLGDGTAWQPGDRLTVTVTPSKLKTTPTSMSTELRLGVESLGTSVAATTWKL
jgi:hypothetical protein